nr:universal stress protein [Schaalia canis]
MLVSTPTIVVGVDGSLASLAAVDWAIHRANLIGARVHIMCMYAMASYSAAALDGGYAGIDAEALEKGAQSVVDAAVERASQLVAPDKGVTISSSIEPGDPASILVEMSAEVDLIVVGSASGGGFMSRLLGTVSSSLPANADCPVVVVPEQKSGKAFTPIDKIVVGVDSSSNTSTALQAAIAETELWGAALTAVSAVPIPSVGGVMGWVPSTGNHDAVIGEIKNGLNIAVDAALEGREMPVARHVLDGSPASLLIEFSTAVDLVVVGTRGGGGFADIFLGSTSQTVISHSTCPVMVVPRSREERAGQSYAWERR